MLHQGQTKGVSKPKIPITFWARKQRNGSRMHTPSKLVFFCLLFLEIHVRDLQNLFFVPLFISTVFNCVFPDFTPTVGSSNPACVLLPQSNYDFSLYIIRNCSRTFRRVFLRGHSTLIRRERVTASSWGIHTEWKIERAKANIRSWYISF